MDLKFLILVRKPVPVATIENFIGVYRPEDKHDAIVNSSIERLYSSFGDPESDLIRIQSVN